MLNPKSSLSCGCTHIHQTIIFRIALVYRGRETLIPFVLEQSVYMMLRDSYMSPFIITTGDFDAPAM
jgi:hypothetical protein